MLDVYSAIFAAHATSPLEAARVRMIILGVDRYGYHAIQVIYDTVMTGETAPKINWPNRAHGQFGGQSRLI